MRRDYIFYVIASSVISLVATFAGASLTVILISALLIPPIILLVIRIIRR